VFKKVDTNHYNFASNFQSVTKNATEQVLTSGQPSSTIDLVNKCFRNDALATPKIQVVEVLFPNARLSKLLLG